MMKVSSKEILSQTESDQEISLSDLSNSYGLTFSISLVPVNEIFN